MKITYFHFLAHRLPVICLHHLVSVEILIGCPEPPLFPDERNEMALHGTELGSLKVFFYFLLTQMHHKIITLAENSDQFTSSFVAVADSLEPESCTADG